MAVDANPRNAGTNQGAQAAAQEPDNVVIVNPNPKVSTTTIVDNFDSQYETISGSIFGGSV
jgi:hypothetical protein